MPLPCIRRLLPALGCLVLLASCESPDHTATLEGHWASHAETDYSYPASSFKQIPRIYVPTSVIGKSSIVITPDSFIHYNTRGPFPRRMAAHSYKHLDSVIYVPVSGQHFVLKILTADTLQLVYERPTPTGTQFEYGHVNTAFTYTRLRPANEVEAYAQQLFSYLRRLYPSR